MDNAYMYLSVGLAVFMAVVLLFGFLLGLIRGWKKSVLRFSIFVGISIIVLLCMPAILWLQINLERCISLRSVPISNGMSGIFRIYKVMVFLKIM